MILGIVYFISILQIVICRYLVFSDPPGAKIGCGGATMYVLEQLQKIIPQEELSKGMFCILIVVYAVVDNF